MSKSKNNAAAGASTRFNGAKSAGTRFAALGALTVAGGLLLVSQSPRTPQTAATRGKTGERTPAARTAHALPKARASATVYRVSDRSPGRDRGDDGGGVGRLVRATVGLTPAEAGDPERAVRAALNRMAGLERSPLPEGARAKSVTLGDGGLATVDFTAALRDGFRGGGDAAEALVLNAIVLTLGQFPGVKRVQILVEGERTPLGGTQDTTEPLPVPDGLADGVTPGGTQVARKP